MNDPLKIAGKIFADRWRADELKAEGGMSFVYSGIDIKTNKRVAIKIIKNETINNWIENFIRFRREVSIISKLKHPGLADIYETGEKDGMNFMVMEWIDGKGLGECIDCGSGQSIFDSMDIIKQVAEILDHVHAAGIVHRDIKPGNIMVYRSEGKCRVKLIDFGLAQLVELSKMLSSNVSAVFNYMSPEQTGIIRKPVDERSDLYSLGVIAYELLTGELPFKGDDVAAILHQQIAKQPKPLSQIKSEIPEILEKIVLKLINKDPEDRYQTAKGLLQDLVKWQNGETDFELGRGDIMRKLNFRARFIDREKEFGRLKEMFSQISQSGRVCLVSGDAGMGKTRLMDEFRSFIYGNDGTFIFGKCIEQDYETPYQPFIEALSDHLSQVEKLSNADKEESFARMRQSAGDMGEIICRISPEMRKVFGETPPLFALDPEKENKRFLMVASRFFRNLSIRGKRSVLVIDNVCFADEGTLSLIDEISQDISESKMLLVILYRENEPSSKPNLRKLINSLTMREDMCSVIGLSNLDIVAHNKMVSELLFEDEASTEKLSSYIFMKSKGNPLFTIEIMRTLYNDGALVYGESGWQADWGKVEIADISPTILELLMKKMGSLNDDFSALLSKAAVIGKKFYIDILFALCDGPRDEIVEMLDSCVSMQILEMGLEKGEVRFTHDKIREYFCNKLDDGNRQKLHRKIAEILEQINHKNLELVLFDLANHYSEAGDNDKSLLYSFPAAEKALKTYANEEAEKYYGTVLKILDDRDLAGSAQWIKAKEGLAAVYLTMGRNDEAIMITEQTIPLKSTPLEKARTYKQIGAAYFKKGDLALCEKNLVKGLSLLGENFPSMKKRPLLRLGKEVLSVALSSLFPAAFLHKKNRPVRDEDREIIWLYFRMFWMFALSDVSKFIYSTFRVLNLAVSRIGISRELSMAYNLNGSAWMAIPFNRFAVYYFNNALKINVSMNNIQGLAETHQQLGFCLSWGGDYLRSIESFNQSKEEFMKMGDLWEVAQVWNGIGHNYLYLAQYEKSMDAFNHYFSISQKIGDNVGITSSQASLSLCYSQKGDLELAKEWGESAERISGNNKLLFYNCYALISLGYMEYEKGNYREAVGYLERARKLNESGTFLKNFTVNLYPNLADAYIECACNVSSLKNDVSNAKNLVKAALRETRSWPNHYCSALRSAAKYYSFTGNNRRAKNYFRASIESAKKLGRRYETARSCFEFAKHLNGLNRNEEAAQYWVEAFGIFKEIGAKKYIERTEKYLSIRPEMSGTTQERLTHQMELTSIITASHYLSSILDLDVLLNKTMDVSIEVAGAERGFLFLYPEKEGEGKELALMLARGADKNVYEGKEKEVCIPVLQRAAETSEAVLVGDAQNEEWLKYVPCVKEYGLRSIICIPLIVRDKMIGVLYLDNRLVSGLFNEEKLELLKTVLAQASISIVNARTTEQMRKMQDELKRYAEGLEGKVKDRTLDLEKSLNQVEEANRNKTQFVSDVSHELRTPLASIKGYVSTIRSDPDMPKPTREEFLGIVEDETDRLARIIDQLLDISRIEAGRLKLNLRSFQLKDLLHRNVEGMREQARKKQVTIEENISTEPVQVYADQDKTAQVIINLLSNAVKYNKPGGVIKVNASSQDGKIRVDVEDTGYGISEKDIPHMFEKFYRVERTSNEAPGTGLGLAVTKNLIEVMGGNIMLESRFGEGSKFSFTLPKGAKN